MLSEVFYWLFNMSLVASITGIVVLLIRLIRIIPRRVITVIWAIPFLRMWIPVGIGGKYSLMTIISKFTTKTVTVYEGEIIPAFTFTNEVMAADSYFPITYKVNFVGDVFRVSSVIWIVIALAIIMTFVFIYSMTMKEIKGSEHFRDNVFVSNSLTSPSVYGVFRPKIVIPKTMIENDYLQYVLLHEQKHVSRLDNLWRIIGFASAAVHWFNPLSWIFLKCFITDLEIACDESVLQKCCLKEQKEYALALVSFAECRTIFISAFGGAKIRTRIERILSFRKMTAASAIVFAVLIAAISYFLLTNAS